jgi:very-short-patch-repair endonuclease
MVDQLKLSRARALRQGNNMPEALLWNALKSRKLENYKFVRQYPLGPYFADFCCRGHKLVIELDGSQHVDSSYDRRRDLYMQEKGFAVLRFWSGNALSNLDGVIDTILFALQGGYQSEVVAHDLRFVPWILKPLRHPPAADATSPGTPGEE